MTRNVRWMLGGLAVWLGVAALSLPAAAGLDDFKLTKAIPADAAFAAHGRDHAGAAFLNEQYARVWKAVESQHFEKDLRTLLKGLVQQDGGDPEEFESNWQLFNDLLAGVEWSALADDEYAVAAKLSFPTPEFIMLGMSPADKVASNFAGLTEIIKGLAGFAPEGALVLATQGEGDSVVTTLSFANAPFPVGFMLAREKNVLMLGFGQTMPEQALALLRGEPGQTLASTERFQAALKQLPPPTDSVVYMDLARWFGQVRDMVGQAMSMADPTGEDLDPKIKALPGKVIDALDMFEYMAAVSTTSGLKTMTDSVTLLREDAKSHALYDVFFSNGTLKEPLKFIPANSQNMSVWSGFSVRALYDAVIKFIGDEVPDGEALLAEWEQSKEELKTQDGLDVEADLINWIGGGISSFSIPPKSTYSSPEWVFMLSVKDEAKAGEMLGRLMDMIAPMLAEQNGMVDDAKIEGAEGFKVVVHPMLAMMPGFGQPTAGVKHGQLFIGSSAKAVAAALATGAGETPNFSTNERFLKEGLPLGKDVMSVSFTDLTKLGDELGQMLMMVPMIGMFAPEVAKNPAGRALLSASTKAGKVVQELNFFQSSCTETTFKGRTVYAKTVMNYREPPRPAAATSTTPSEPESESESEE